MDHCTPQFYTTLPTVGCYQTYDCRASTDGTKQLCNLRACVTALPQPQWTCVKPDGSQYVWQEELTSGTSKENR